MTTTINNSQPQGYNPLLLGAGGAVVGAGAGALAGSFTKPEVTKDMFVSLYRKAQANKESDGINKLLGFWEKGVDKLSDAEKNEIIKLAKEHSDSENFTITKDSLKDLIVAKHRTKRIYESGADVFSKPLKLATEKKSKSLSTLQDLNKQADEINKSLLENADELWSNRANHKELSDAIDEAVKAMKKSNMKKYALIGGAVLAAIGAGFALFSNSKKEV